MHPHDKLDLPTEGDCLGVAQARFYASTQRLVVSRALWRFQIVLAWPELLVASAGFREALATLLQIVHAVL